MTYTGYKLVQLPLYTSIMAPPPYSKYYPIGETVTADPNTVGLMIFESLATAGSFCASARYYGWAVLKVEYDSSDIIITDYIALYLDLESLDLFYLKGPRPSLMRVRLLVPPLGTVCCKKLKVISKLKGEPHS